MKRLRGKLTYSNVMVTILALIVLGGGTAYAATAGLPPNSVGAAQLQANSVGLGEMKADSVGSAELQPEAVGPSQLQNESITAGKIKDGSVTPSKLSAQVKSELKGQKGEAGAQGAQGPAGAQGAPGASATVETEVVNAATATNTTAEKELTVHCPHGPVLGGGFVLAPEIVGGEPHLRAVRSYAVSPESWLVRAFDDGGADNWELTVDAVCEK
jgi:hypothetical protein